MSRHLLAKAMLLIVILLLTGSIVSAALPSTDPIPKARQITCRLLRQVQRIVPFITLAFCLMGGITYITAAEDNKQRVMGKKYILMGLTGIILVYVVAGIAPMPPFSITGACCDNICNCGMMLRGCPGGI